MAEDKKSKVWVIYQGENREPSLTWVKEVFTELTQNNTAQGQYTTYNEPTFEGTILDAVYKDIVACDIAIALVTKDERWASEAGNLWFEIGLWLGRKGGSSIRVFVHNDAESEESQKIISDIGGYPYERYSDESELREKIKDFIQKRRDNHQGVGGDRRRKKIRDVLARGSNGIWLGDEPYKCKRNGGNVCDVRLNSYAFSSELLRMSKTNREVSVIKTKYLQYARLIKVIESKKSTGMPDDNLNDRRRYMQKLAKDLKGIDYLASTLFRRTKANYNKEEGGDWPPKQRWFNFIKSRLEAAKELRDNMIYLLGKSMTADEREQLDAWKHVLEEEVCIETLCEQNKTIVKMIDDYIKPNGGYQEWNFYKYGSFNEKTKRIEDYSESGVFATMKEYFSNVADVLDVLLSYYYNTCRSLIDEKLGAIPDPNSMHLTLEEIKKLLPHNGAPGHRELSKYRIWPANVVGV